MDILEVRHIISKDQHRCSRCGMRLYRDGDPGIPPGTIVDAAYGPGDTTPQVLSASTLPGGPSLVEGVPNIECTQQ